MLTATAKNLLFQPQRPGTALRAGLEGVQREILEGETITPDPDFEPMPVTGAALEAEQERVRKMLEAKKNK